MNLKNVLYGLFLCSVVSSVCAGDGDVFKLVDSDLIEQQENRINYGEQVPVKSVVQADLKDLDDGHPLSAIAHPRDEEGALEEGQSDVTTVETTGAPIEQENAAQHVSEAALSTIDNSKTNENGEDSEITIVQVPDPSGDSNGFAFLSIKEISKQQLFALTAGVMFAGYCLYKIWDMFTASVEQVEEELKITLTHQDRDILFTLLQAMVQDIENLRENKHEVCAVGQIDISALSEILAPECKVICSNFVELYNAIDSSGNNIEFIIMFYGQFERAVQALLLQAEII